MGAMVAFGTWLGQVLDVGVIVLLAVLLWRLGQDRTEAWREGEEKLAGIFAGLQALVARAEGLATELNRQLLDSERRLKEARAPAERTDLVPEEQTAGVVRAGPEAGPVPAEPRALVDGSAAELRRRVARLAASRVSVEEISRRLGIPAAAVRLLIGLSRFKAPEVGTHPCVSPLAARTTGQDLPVAEHLAPPLPTAPLTVALAPSEHARGT